jgi:hypothetical protein
MICSAEISPNVKELLRRTITVTASIQPGRYHNSADEILSPTFTVGKHSAIHPGRLGANELTAILGNNPEDLYNRRSLPQLNWCSYEGTESAPTKAIIRRAFRLYSRMQLAEVWARTTDSVATKSRQESLNQLQSAMFVVSSGKRD